MQSPSQSSATDEKTGHFGRIIWRVLVGLVTLLLLWNVIWRMGNASAVNRLLAEARERGEPVTKAELAAKYPAIPDEENAYVALDKIWSTENPALWQALQTNRWGEDLDNLEEQFAPDLPVLGNSQRLSHTNAFTPEAIQAMNDFVQAKKEHFAAVRAALERPSFRAPNNYEAGLGINLPHLGQMKMESKFFQVEALHAIERGDIAQALDAIHHSVLIGHQLKHEPLILSQLVRVTCYEIAVRCAERLVSQRQLTDDQLSALQATFTNLSAHAGMKDALICERIFQLGAFTPSPEEIAVMSEPPAGDSPEEASMNYAKGLRFYSITGMKNAEQRLMAEAFEKLIACVQNPDYATNQQMQEIINETTQTARRFPPKILAQMHLPSMAKAADRFARAEAVRRCTITALAVERYRRRHDGSLPASLTDVPRELLPESFTDPFTGEPLRFKRLPNGYVIYSVGTDRKDNDGELYPPRDGSNSRESDVGFRVEREAGPN
jgi:hypothetical protein